MTEYDPWPHKAVDDETFRTLDSETRALVLRLLNAETMAQAAVSDDTPEPQTDDDVAALQAHPQGKKLAAWLLTLPAFRRHACHGCGATVLDDSPEWDEWTQEYVYHAGEDDDDLVDLCPHCTSEGVPL